MIYYPNTRNRKDFQKEMETYKTRYCSSISLYTSSIILSPSLSSQRRKLSQLFPSPPSPPPSPPPVSSNVWSLPLIISSLMRAQIISILMGYDWDLCFSFSSWYLCFFFPTSSHFSLPPSLNVNILVGPWFIFSQSRNTIVGLRTHLRWYCWTTGLLKSVKG